MSPPILTRLLLSLTVLALPAVLGAEEAPPLAAGLERNLVVGGQGYFPVAIRLQDKRIAVVLRGGAAHVGVKGRIDVVFSSDEGQTWTKPGTVVDSPFDDRNPAFGQADDGTLVVGYYRTATYDEKGNYNPKLDKPRETFVTRSVDGGKTWSESIPIDVSEFGWGSPFGKIVTLPGGRLLMAIYGGSRRAADEKPAADHDHSYIYSSDNRGACWKFLAEIGDGKQQLNETALVRLRTGKLVAAVRSRDADLWLSESTDSGKSWSTCQQVAPRRAIPADLVELEDGRLWLAVGNRIGPFGAAGLVSDSSGRFDWAQRTTLVNDARNTDCGYPSSVLLDDGRLLTVYYATQAIEHPEWGVHCGALIYPVPPAAGRSP